VSTVDEPGVIMAEAILQRHAPEPSSLIAVMQDLNRECRYVPEEALRVIARRLAVPLSRVYHVATFYTAFSLKPRGRHSIKVCMGTACHVRGAPRILDQFARKLAISPGETTPDGEFTLETVNCLGACALGPVVVVDDHYHRASLNTVGALIREAREGVTSGIPAAELDAAECTCAGAGTGTCPYLPARVKAGNVTVAACGGTGCQAYGCELVAAALENELRKQGVAGVVHFRQTGCRGFCERGPIVIVGPENIFYQKVDPADAAEIVLKTVIRGEVIDRLLYVTASGERVDVEEKIPFYAQQQRLILGDNGRISPTRIDDYLATGGYQALAKALKMQPDTIIDEITRSGLRGRGGGGFPTGRK